MSTGFSLPISLPARFWGLFWSSASTSNSRYSVGCGGAASGASDAVPGDGEEARGGGAAGGRQKARGAPAGCDPDIRPRRRAACGPRGERAARPGGGGCAPWRGPAGRSQSRLAEQGQSSCETRSGLSSKRRPGAAPAAPAAPTRAPRQRAAKLQRASAHAPGREPSSHSGASCRAKAQHCCEPGSPRAAARCAAPCWAATACGPRRRPREPWPWRHPCAGWQP